MNIQDWTETRYDCKLFSAVVESLDPNTHAAECHQHRDNEEVLFQKSYDSVECYRGEAAMAPEPTLEGLQKVDEPLRVGSCPALSSSI